jgi:hypothetical protein
MLPLAACITLLGACEARFGNDAGEVAENATAAGRAQDGRLTIEAPGFNLSVQIPEGVRSEGGFGEDEGLIYPGASFGGIHVQGTPDGANGDGEVELRFSTSDAVDRVVGWYRDPARNADFTVQSVRQEGPAFVVSGTGQGEGNSFALNVTPRPGGGTEARLVLSDRSR